MDEELEKFLLKWNATIGDAINLLDRVGGLICIVIDDNGRAVGTITDGDIRRALLKNISLRSPLDEVVQRNFVSVDEGASKNASMRLMRERKLKCIPVLNSAGKPLELHVAEQYGAHPALPNHAVLMAGGKGTRLFPITRDIPKPMLNVGDKPILERIVENLIEQGIQTFWISINYLGEAIKAHFQDGSRWGVDINYLEEDKPRGTAGSLELLPIEDMNAPVFVMNGDIVANINLERMVELHKSAGAVMTIGSKLHNINVPFGVLQVSDGRVTGLSEKPDMELLVNAGFYLLEPEILKLIPPGAHLDMTELMGLSIEAGQKVSPFVLLDSWMDIGLPDQLQNARNKFS